ncbi:MAG: bacterioferritin-associated ferredoxin [Hyphomicrobiaceae bacterium]
MIICSCNVISDGDIERVLVEIFSKPDAPIPTPGLVYRELSKRMNCCTCAPVAVTVIYERLEALEKRGQICRYRCAHIRDRLRLIVNKNSSKQAVLSDDAVALGAHLDVRSA